MKIRPCVHNSKNNKCLNGFYPFEKTPPFCRGEILVPEIPPCCKEDRLPDIHNGSGKPIQIKERRIK